MNNLVGAGVGSLLALAEESGSSMIITETVVLAVVANLGR